MAVCTWKIPPRTAGKALRAAVEVRVTDGTLVRKRLSRTVRR
jgi:hypothetical protein